MNLPQVNDIEAALRVRAKKGPEASGSHALSDLTLVRTLTDTGLSSADAVDKVLWDAIESADYTSFVAGPKAYRRSKAAIRCSLAIYARLDLADRLEDGCELAQDNLFPVDHASTARERAPWDKEGPEERHNQIRMFDRDASYYPKGALKAVLALSRTGSIDKFVGLAPKVIAAALVAREDELLEQDEPQPSSAIERFFAKVRAAEDKLCACGLSPSFFESERVKETCLAVIDALEGPLSHYADAGLDFDFVSEQLKTTQKTLHGVSVDADTKVNGNSDYETAQMVALENGLNIERIFIFGAKDKTSVLKTAKDQQEKADRVKQQSSEAGTYRAHFVKRSVAARLDPKGELFSIAILDEGEPTQRVVKQVFGRDKHLNRREASSHHAEIERAVKFFRQLKGERETF